MELETLKAPKVSHDENGWRVDLPGGDFAYQPSEQFAMKFARDWIEVKNNQYLSELAAK